MRKTIDKVVLIGLVALGVSFQALAEGYKTYYPTGELEQVRERVDGKKSKTINYDKAGKVKGILEYVDGKQYRV